MSIYIERIIVIFFIETIYVIYYMAKRNSQVDNLLCTWVFFLTQDYKHNGT